MDRVPKAPCIDRPCGALGAAARGGGAVYTGRGPVWGVIILLCCTIGWPGTGFVEGGAAGVPCGFAATGGVAGGFCAVAEGGVTTTAGGCAGGVTTTAGGAAGFSTGGGATTAGAAVDHGRCNHSTSFRCRSSRFGHYNGWLFCRGRSCRRRRGFHGHWRSSRWGGHGRRFGRRRGRMLLLLLSLSEQPCYVARLGNLGEVDLRFDLCRGRSFPRRRPGPGRKMLSYQYRFILLNRA